MQVLKRPPSGWPALVLNADYRPLSYYPLSLWPWQEVIKAVFLDRVDVVSTYDHMVHSPSFEMKLPTRSTVSSKLARDMRVVLCERVFEVVAGGSRRRAQSVEASRGEGRSPI